jgi:hypothetical protein
MISVIISSADPAQLKQITDNVTQTIGVQFEIIAINNSDGKKGICEVYNKGANNARFGILCFMHEDIIIKTQNWGAILYKIFKNDTNIGLVGVAGAAYKSLSPSPWSGYGIDTKHINLLQSYKHQLTEAQLLYRNPQNVKLATVACIDGVFMCTTKNVFSDHKFDEDTFKGFHIYDVDFSLNIGQTYKVSVTFDILLNHLSEGSYNKAWLLDNLKLHEKWKNILPVNIENLSLKQQLFIEKVTFKAFVKFLQEFNMPVNMAYKMLWENKRFRKLYFRLFLKLNYYLLKLSVGINK